MKTNKVWGTLPIDWNDFGINALSESGMESYEHMICSSLPDEFVICGDEVIAPIDAEDPFSGDFREWFSDLKDRCYDRLLNMEGVWEDM